MGTIQIKKVERTVTTGKTGETRELKRRSRLCDGYLKSCTSAPPAPSLSDITT